MKSLLFLLFIFFSCEIAAQSETKIDVIIDNVTGNEGQVILYLHDESSFMKTTAFQTKTSEIKNGRVAVTFENVPKGTYGIIALHDKNSNGRIDVAANGIPTEAYGVSNNPMSFGPPRWSEAKFEVMDEPVELNLRF